MANETKTCKTCRFKVFTLSKIEHKPKNDFDLIYSGTCHLSGNYVKDDESCSKHKERKK